MSVTTHSTAFKKKRNAQDVMLNEPPSLAEKRQAVLDAISGQKLKATDYMQADPEAPDFDSEKFKKAKNLSKIALIAQGIDALTGAIGRARTDDTGSYQSAPIRADQLGIDAYNTLANMDQDHTKQLRNYKNTVFNTKRYNQQARQKVDSFNKGVDTNVAKQNLNFELQDEQARAAAATAKKAEQQAIQKAKDAKKAERIKTYIQEGHRLVSQGDERAAIEAYKKAGLDQQGIAASLASHRGGGVSGQGAPVTPDPIKKRMVQEYLKLENEIIPYSLQNANKADFDEKGHPITPKGRKFAKLDDALKAHDIYNPDYQPDESGPSDGQSGGHLSGKKDTNPTYMTGKSIDPKNANLIEQVWNTHDRSQQRELTRSLIEKWRENGLNDQQIRINLDRMFGALSVGDLNNAHRAILSHAKNQQ